MLKAYSFGSTAWFLDSGCSNHMTGEKDLFASLELHDTPKEAIAYGGNSKGDVIGMDKIVISHDNSITNVYLVESWRYNL